MEPERKQKRIVSKAEYAKVQSIRLGLNASSFRLLFFMGCTFLFTVGSILLFISLLLPASEPINVYIAILAFGFLTGSAGLLSWKLFVASVNKTKALGNIVPLTRANIADISAPDSLVRASEKPEQAQADVLLRAVTDVQQNAPEQLLRSSIETIETKG